MTYSNVVAGFVDVQDVSLRHILAYENPTAKGRYILGEKIYHYKDIVGILRELFPGYPVPAERYEPSKELPTYTLSNEKAQRELGIKFKPLESQLKALVASLQEKGWLKAPEE